MNDINEKVDAISSQLSLNGVNILKNVEGVKI